MKTRPRQSKCPTKYCRNTRGKNGGPCSKCQMRKWRAANPLKAAFANLRKSAAERKIPFSLTLEEFAAFCQRTGYLDLKGSQRRSDLQCDRVDFTRGYSADNIQALPLSENAYKGNYERWHGLGRTRGMDQTEAML